MEWRYSPYSWHQSHDQATVLLMVPSDTTEEEMSVIIEHNYLVAGVRGQPPIVKGRLYANVDTVNSVWQLEPRSSRLSHGHRSRTTSTASTTSTQSSYAIISDPEISSSFAASLTLESGQVSESDAEDSLGPSQAPSPGLSSPYSSADEAPTQQARGFGPGFQPSGTGLRTGTTAGPRSNSASRGVSPGHAAGTTAHNANAALSADGGAGAGVITLHSLPPSFSSLESLSTTADSGRLLTLHLEKEQPAIWPSLITGPVPESMAPSSVNANSMYNSNSLTYAYVTDGLNASHELEHRYNMDPTSLTLMALELFDIRKDKEEAFEFFLRAWHLAHSPTATMKLVTYYLPIHVSYNIPSLAIDSLSSSSSSSQSQTLLTPGTGSSAPRGTTTYYLQCIGGSSGLARLYLEAGMLYLEGTAPGLMHSSHMNSYSSSLSSLSTIRMPLPENGFTPGYGPGYGIEYGYGYGYGNGNGPRPSASTNTRITGTTMTMTTEEAWRRDQIAAARFFDRAKVLEPAIEAQVPKLPSVESVLAGQGQGWDGYGSYGQWEGGEDGYGEEDEEELEMPCIELNTGGVGLGVGLGTETMRRRRSRARRRGQGQGQSKANEAQNRSGISAKGSKVQEQEGAVDGTWYILNMIPGLVGAGTALVVVGVVGVLSFSSWSRRNHGS